MLTLFAGRLVQLQGMESGYYKAAAAAEQVQVNPLPALRGTIYGSNGQPLAMTLETYTVTADPPLIPDADKPSVAQELAAPLDLSAAQVLDLLRHPSFDAAAGYSSPRACPPRTRRRSTPSTSLASP